MANVHLDYQQLQGSASQLQNGKQEIETQLDRLQTMIRNLVGSGFATDQASGKFRDSYEQWTLGAKNVVGGLEGMTSFLNNAITQHQELDRRLSQSTG